MHPLIKKISSHSFSKSGLFKMSSTFGKRFFTSSSLDKYLNENNDVKIISKNGSHTDRIMKCLKIKK